MNAASPAPGIAPYGVRLIGTLRGHGDAVGDIAWSPDMSLLATASKDATVRIWDGASHRHLHTITAHKDGVRAAAFDRHGRVLATGSDDGIVNLWQVGGWKLLKTLDISSDISGCNTLAFSPGQDVLACGGVRAAALIDIASGKIRHRFHQESSGDSFIHQIVFDSTGATIATASGYGSSSWVGLWDASDGRHLAAIDYTATLDTVAFAPDDRLLASGSADMRINI